MVAATPAGKFRLPPRSRVLGPLATVGAILVVALLSATVLEGNLAARGVLYALVVGAIVYAALTGGLRSGLASAVLAAAYAVPHYLALDGVFPALRDRLVLAGGVVAFDLGLALLVGLLQARADTLSRHALEAEQHHSAELEAKNAQLARANEALAEANEALEAFTYVVSHDLKEPVRAINAFSRALEEDHAASLGPDGRDLVHRNLDASQRLARLIEGLLEFSRASRVGPHDLEPIRVEETLASADCVTRFEHVLAERHARLSVTPGPSVLASPPALAQALGNLVLNALRHNPHAKPVVRVGSATWREDPAFVEVVIEDNGPGFPPAVLDRFAKLKEGRPSTVRGGFGLLIARRAVERMGGQMWLERSKELGGAAVRFTLPAAQGPARPPGSVQETTSRPTSRQG